MPDSTFQIDVLSELRQQTRSEHVALEDSMPFFRAEFSRHDYVCLLEKFLGIFEPLHVPIQKRLQQLPDSPPPFDRIQLLRHDLLALGRTDSAIASLPRCRFLPTVNSTADALGVFYVLEGSMLGGQAIARELRDRFDIGPANGASFFSCHGIDVKARWAAVRDLLRNQLVLPGALEVAVSSANATFRSFHAWFAPQPQPR